jgi:WXG100 family type VII secretion target
MQATSQKFTATEQELTGMLRTLMSQLEGLQSAWKGAGSAAFQQVQQQWNTDMQTLSRALSETAEAIGKAGTFYSNTDSDAASRVNSVGGAHVQLPL